MGNSESVNNVDASKKLLKDLHNNSLICEEKFENYSFMLYNLSKKSHYDYSTISIFRYNFDRYYESLLYKFNKGVSSKLLNVRHPNVLKCLDTISDDSTCLTTNSCQHYFVTEPVVPLSKVLSSLTECEVILGFYQIMQALQFLHEQANIAHCALSFRGAIFVSLYSGSDWRLGAGEFMYPLNKLDHERIGLLENLKGAVTQENQPSKTVTWNIERPDSYDIFCLGQLILEILEITGCFDMDLMAFAHTAASACCHSDPMQRPTITELLSHNVFCNAPLVCLNKGLRNITVLSPEEQASFFEEISYLLFALPEEVVAYRLANLLLSRAVLVQPLAKKHLLPLLLYPYKHVNGQRPSNNSQLLSESLFAQHVAPLLACILEVRERHVRLALLEHFSNFAHLLQLNDLRRLLPHILLGLHDSYPPLVAATFHALGELTTLLGSSVILAGLSTSLSSTNNTNKSFFVEGGPRTNNLLKDVIPPIASLHPHPLREAELSTDSTVLDKINSLKFDSEVEVRLPDFLNSTMIDDNVHFNQMENEILKPDILANRLEDLKNDDLHVGLTNAIDSHLNPKNRQETSLDAGDEDDDDNDETWLQFEVEDENVSHKESGAMLVSDGLQEDCKDVCDLVPVSQSLGTDFFVDMEPSIAKQTVPLEKYISDGKLQISSKFAANEAEDESLYQGDWGDSSQ